MNAFRHVSPACRLLVALVLPVRSLRELPRLCPDCLPEILETEYFGGTPGKEPPRLKGPVAPEVFDQAARSGKVLILENASAGMALEGWSCERLAQEFPDAKMRREYDWVKNPQDRNLQEFRQVSWTSTLEQGEDAQERLRQDANAPPFAPFYWGVREHRNGDVGSKKVVQRMQRLIAKSVPTFMDPENAKSLFDNGAGRSPDGEVVFDDGVAYQLGWKPMFEFTVKEGEAVLFPPGWIHETLNTAETCTVALTTQFDVPIPVRYYRSFYNRLRRVGDLNACWEWMTRWPGGRLSKDLAKAKSMAYELYDKKTLNSQEIDFFDLNEDGNVTQQEFVDTFVAWTATEKAIKKEKKKNLPACDMAWDEKILAKRNEL